MVKIDIKGDKTGSNSRKSENAASMRSSLPKRSNFNASTGLRLNLPEKGVIAQQRELKIQRSEHFHDFMHRLAMAFSKWIMVKLNEESYLHKNLEVHMRRV
jgi:hypothetical protein